MKTKPEKEYKEQSVESILDEYKALKDLNPSSAASEILQKTSGVQARTNISERERNITAIAWAEYFSTQIRIARKHASKCGLGKILTLLQMPFLSESEESWILKRVREITVSPDLRWQKDNPTMPVLDSFPRFEPAYQDMDADETAESEPSW